MGLGRSSVTIGMSMLSDVEVFDTRDGMDVLIHLVGGDSSVTVVMDMDSAERAADRILAYVRDRREAEREKTVKLKAPPF